MYELDYHICVDFILSYGLNRGHCAKFIAGDDGKQCSFNCSSKLLRKENH